jgi:hypothetical protein
VGTAPQTTIRLLGPGDEEVVGKLAGIARARGIREGFVLTDAGNDPANGLYRSLGGERVDSVMWDFTYTGS